MQTRDDTRIIELLSTAESSMRNTLIELVSANAKSGVLYSVVSAIGAIESASISLDESHCEDDY